MKVRASLYVGLLALAALVMPAVLAGAGNSAYAQGAAQNASDVISDIVVQGNQRIEAATVRSYMTIQPGDVYDPAKVDASLKTLFATGLFADVAIRRETAVLIVAVVENPIINRVAFEGNEKLNDEDLEEEVQLRVRTVYTRARVQSDVQRIIELYRRNGRFAATVEPKVVQLPQNRVDLIFEINEGPVTGVSRINFIGNEVFSDGELRSQIATSESRWWKILSTSDNYDPDRVTFDRELLRRFYLSQGYADFRVVSAVAKLSRDGEDFFITFTVDEGEQYTFGDVAVETELDRLDTERLRSLVLVKPGEIYDVNKIDDTIEALTFAAGVEGYAFVDVRPRVQRLRDERVINVTFQIDEGPRVYVERININGNTRTLDKVIRREFRLVEGDAFNRILLDRSKQRIRALGFFSEVEITEEPGSTEDKTIVNVDVVEQSTGELSLGAGFSSTDSVIADFSLTERNLLGRGQFLRLRLSLSGRRNQIDVRFTEPYFLDRNIAAGFDLFAVETDFSDESSFDVRSTGLALRSAFPLSEFSRLALRYTLRQDEISDVQSDASLIVQSAAGEEVTSAVGYTYSIDRRNDPIDPTDGWQLSFSQDVAGVGGSVNYLRSEASGGVYFGLAEDFTLGLSLDAGYIVGFAGDDVELNDRFFKGGNTFRGFETSGVGPRDLLTDDSLGGNLYAIGSAELTVPLGLPDEFGITGSIFSDFGTVGLVDDNDITALGIPLTNIEDDLALRASVGFSLFWESPFGPVRLDFAEAVLKEDYDKDEFFRFSAGTRF